MVVSRNGRPAAVLMSVGDLESLEESLDVLSDPDPVEGLRAAAAEIDRLKAVRGSTPYEHFAG